MFTAVCSFCTKDITRKAQILESYILFPLSFFKMIWSQHSGRTGLARSLNILQHFLGGVFSAVSPLLPIIS